MANKQICPHDQANIPNYVITPVFKIKSLISNGKI